MLTEPEDLMGLQRGAGRRELRPSVQKHVSLLNPFLTREEHRRVCVASKACPLL